MLDLLVRNAVLPGGERVDIGVQDEKFAVLTPEVQQDAKISFNAEGLTVLSGLIDMHVHFNEPGNTHWEGVFTGSRAFAAGGGCVFVDMPLNSIPTTLDRTSLEFKKEAMKQSQTDYALWGGLTPINLDCLEELAEGGVIGFKAFMSDSGLPEFENVSPGVLHQGMERAAKLGLPVAVHAEDPQHLGAYRNMEDFTASRPIAAENSAVQIALDIARDTGCHLHLVHLSNVEAVMLALNAREQGVKVSIETCPHYLFFNEQDLLDQGVLLKCAPPLRPEVDRRMLLKAVEKGWVDVIGSDHSPAPPDMKRGDFAAAWGGISSVQTTLSVLLTLGLGFEQVQKLLSEHPALLLGMQEKGRLQVGLDADFLLLDPQEKVLTVGELQDRHRLNPYLSHGLRGRVLYNFVRGHPVYERGQFSSFTPKQIQRHPQGQRL
ncbi:allantoinase AllB [Deinococcus cellulosilyticus]|uniref:Allantoinase n=1 Tax=Deinococcus cellulosilyticus (strain DSM 18568 / NBRC 106333 / KACC 11606 / 5516J-15) TaxID=1223518 RepID=A0A511NBA4_DEIC1|nr:allantoinase AllB [Deinococcus cellulosilyticus]GEM50084.1 allantoinase [Deinococcus cellulosilyticus NBRC 106333 = KACC 11606]